MLMDQKMFNKVVQSAATFGFCSTSQHLWSHLKSSLPEVKLGISTAGILEIRCRSPFLLPNQEHKSTYTSK